MFDSLINSIRSIYPGKDFIPLHEPCFQGKEKEYLIQCVDSGFVSSVGQFVVDFEKAFAAYTGAQHAVAASNGTNGLHLALVTLGVGRDDLVITQALSFVATVNAIHYSGASPVFLDVEKDTLSLCPLKLREFLEKECCVKAEGLFHKSSQRKVSACVLMHTLGHPGNAKQIAEILAEYQIPLVEDAAEALGSYKDNQHVGLEGQISVFSFNGNKVITTGGGGMLVTNNESLAKRAKHLSTTAKVAHAYEFFHDEIGYNYRMPNLNAALGLAQLEQLEKFLTVKNRIAKHYRNSFANLEFCDFLESPKGCKSNYWLNGLLFKTRELRDNFLKVSNENGVMTRPLWTPLNQLPPYKDCVQMDLSCTRNLYDRVVNLPSGVHGVSI